MASGCTFTRTYVSYVWPSLHDQRPYLAQTWNRGWMYWQGIGAWSWRLGCHAGIRELANPTRAFGRPGGKHSILQV